MLRILALFLFSVAAVFSGACAGAEKIRISFIARAMDSEYWQTVRKGAESAAAGHPDIELVFCGPQSHDRADEQIALVERELLAGSKVMIIAPCDERRIVAVLDTLHLHGVKVVLYDSESSWPDKASRIGSNNVMGGYLAAEYISARLGGEGKVGVITGSLSSSPAITRANGAREALRIRRGMKLVGVKSADWSGEKAYGRALEFLDAHPDLDAIFCCNDDMAFGALRAVRERGSGAFVVGFDATPTSLRSIVDGGLAATVAQNSFNNGRLAVRAAYRLARNRKIPPVIDTGMQLVTADNVHQFLEGAR